MGEVVQASQGSFCAPGPDSSLVQRSLASTFILINCLSSFGLLPSVAESHGPAARTNPLPRRRPWQTDPLRATSGTGGAYVAARGHPCQIATLPPALPILLRSKSRRSSGPVSNRAPPSKAPTGCLVSVLPSVIVRSV